MNIPFTSCKHYLIRQDENIEKYLELDTTSTLNDCAKYYKEEKGSSTLSQYSTINATNPTINIERTERESLVESVCKCS